MWRGSGDMEKHDLIHEFPEFRERIHDLKVHNSHFRRLFDQYHETDHEVQRVESGMEPTSDEVLNVLRKKRVALKDELYGMLTAPE